MDRPHRIWAALVPSLLVLAALVPDPAAAETGTISGKVVDANGVAVPYANVVLKGTRLGATANLEGKYTIQSVPVGTYTLAVKMLGYTESERTGMPVNAGQVTIVDFKVTERPAAILPPVHVIPQDKLVIRKKEVATKATVTLQELRSRPFTDLKENLGLIAGVTSFRGKIHFRGGRPDEILTLVDGVPTRDPLSAEGVDLGLLSISSSEQVLGGLDAQYGNALSGVIKLTTREGGDKFSGEVRYFTDRYGEADKAFDNFERLSAGLGGPFFFSNSNYFFSLEATYSDTYLKSAARHKEHRFLDFIRIGNRQSNNAKISGKITFRPTPNQKLNVELVKSQSLQGDFHNRWNREGFVQVIQDSTAPSDGSITTRYGTWSQFPVDSTYVPMNTAEHLPVREESYLQTALAWKHAAGIGTVYNIRASRQEWKTRSDVLDRRPWEYQQSPNNYYDSQNRLEGLYYVTNGDFPFYERKRTVMYTLNADVSRNFGRHNFMAGGEINYNDLGYLRTAFPNVIAVSGLYGADRDEFRFFNPEGSLFVQDRWDFEGMVLNIGARYDNFSVAKQIPSAEVRDRVKTQFSPRIGIAYPISDRDVMSFYYGKLFQVPNREYIYQGRLISATVRGNPNLEPETNINYQLGIQHLFTKEIYGQFAVYFKDIFGLLTTVPQIVPGAPVEIPTYVNGDYASSRGIEVTIIKRFTRGFGGEINYTYSNTTGTASDPNRALPDQGNLRDQFKPTTEQPLNWDQRHNLSATLNLGDQKTWGATFVYQFGSGFPYTPHQREERRQDPGLQNSRRLPSITTFSMQGERHFRAWGQDLTFYVQGTNLLDTKNIRTLQPDLWPPGSINEQSYVVYYTETGRAGGAFLVDDQDGDGREDWYLVHDPRVFQPGRTIRVGLGVEF